MRRKEKRLLQVAGLLVAALLFLPNVGLWSLYRDRVFENSPDAADGVPPAQVGQLRGPLEEEEEERGGAGEVLMRGGRRWRTTPKKDRLLRVCLLRLFARPPPPSPPLVAPG